MMWELWDLTVCLLLNPTHSGISGKALNSEDEGIWGSFCFLNQLSNNSALFRLGLTILAVTCVASSWDIWSSVVQIGLVFLPSLLPV